MKKLFLLTIFAAWCLNSAAHETPAVQRVFDTVFEYDVLTTINNVRFYICNPEYKLRIDEARFMLGFREQLRHSSTSKQALHERMHAWEQAQNAHLKSQMQAADFLTPHGKQEGVTILSNGLQYDCFTMPDAAQNYKARRAHQLLGYIPGSTHRVAISSMPDAINNALYQAPRAGAWRFLLPVDLLNDNDASALHAQGIHTVEIIAVRESADEKLCIAPPEVRSFC